MKTYLAALLFSVSSGVLQAESVAFSILDRPVFADTQINSSSAPAASTTVRLHVELAPSLNIQPQHIQWSVHNDQQQLIKQQHGNQQTLNLSTGIYTVELKIDQFSQRKVLVINGQQQVIPYFKADVGRLVMVSNEPIDWSINSLLTPAPPFTVKHAQEVNMIVHAGNYQIRTPLQQQLFTIAANATVKSVFQSPVGRINLIAIADERPLFKPMEWEVFRLEKGNRHCIGRYYQHSQGIKVPPGYYEIVGKYQSIVRSRHIWVQENTHSKVVLAMD